MLVKDIFNTVKLLKRHKLSQKNFASTLIRYARWQIGSRLVPGPVAAKFVNESMLLAKPGLTGATGNIFVGLHEFEEMAFLLHLLRPSDLFVDVGANVGSYTVLASAASGANSISFEPNPETFNWLRRNIDLNGVANKTEIYCAAVGSKEGTATFTVELGCANHIVQSTTVDETQIEKKNQVVAVLTLDGSMQGREPILLKIDVEGFETDVIKGASSLLKSSNLRCIIMELVGHGKNFGFDENAIREEVYSHGFQEFHYDPFERKLINSAENTRSANTIFIRDLPFVEQRLESAKPFSVLNMSM